MAERDSLEKFAADAGQELKTTADEAARTAKTEADGLLAELRPALEALADRVHALTEHSKELAADASRQTRDSVLDARDRAGAQVADKPLQSLAIAAAVGTAIGWLLSRR